MACSVAVAQHAQQLRTRRTAVPGLRWRWDESPRGTGRHPAAARIAVAGSFAGLHRSLNHGTMPGVFHARRPGVAKKLNVAAPAVGDAGGGITSAIACASNSPAVGTGLNSRSAGCATNSRACRRWGSHAGVSAASSARYTPADCTARPLHFFSSTGWNVSGSDGCEGIVFKHFRDGTPC